MSDSDFARQLDIQLAITKAHFSLAWEYQADLHFELPPEVDSSKNSTSDLEEFISSHNVDIFHLMLKNDYQKIILTGANALAFLAMDDLEEGPWSRDTPLFLFEMEYENFLARVVSFHEKTFQLWNVLAGAPLRPGSVRKSRLRQEVNKDDTIRRDVLQKLLDLWDSEPYSDIAKERNASTHRHSLDAIGMGYPVTYPEELSQGGVRFRFGKTRGRIDKAKIHGLIPAAVKQIFTVHHYLLKECGYLEKGEQDDSI